MSAGKLSLPRGVPDETASGIIIAMVKTTVGIWVSEAALVDVLRVYTGRDGKQRRKRRERVGWA